VCLFCNLGAVLTFFSTVCSAQAMSSTLDLKTEEYPPVAYVNHIGNLYQIREYIFVKLYSIFSCTCTYAQVGPVRFTVSAFLAQFSSLILYSRKGLTKQAYELSGQHPYVFVAALPYKLGSETAKDLRVESVPNASGWNPDITDSFNVIFYFFISQPCVYRLTHPLFFNTRLTSTRISSSSSTRPSGFRTFTITPPTFVLVLCFLLFFIFLFYTDVLNLHRTVFSWGWQPRVLYG